MEFNVQDVDLEQLADVAQKGGIAALEELAETGKVAEKPETEDQPPDPEAEAGATPEAPSEAVEDVSEVTPAKPEADQHPTGVATKDGAGVIPYAVLKGARKRAEQIEQQNEVLRKQLDEMTARLNTPAAAEPAPQTTNEVDTRITEMQAQAEQLKDDFPELAGLLAGQIDMLQATRKQLVEVQAQYAAEKQDREAAAQADIADSIQEAIDGNAALSAWKEKAGPEWDAAIEMDSLLRSRPEWADKTYSERFAKVVDMVRVMNPEFEAPAENAPAPAPAPTSTDLKPQAPSSEKRPPVNSLSDIPGGVPPAAGKREQVEELSGSALGNRFLSMSPDQINEYLASLAT